MTVPEGEIVHASAVAHAGQALLIRGASGSGKSALAMQMIGLGATLVADDRTILHRDGPRVLASPPEPIAGMIEVRGLGLLRLPHVGAVPVAFCVDLDDAATERLPEPRTAALLGRPVTLLRRIEGAHLASALMHCLAGGLLQPDDLQPDSFQPEIAP